MNNNNNIDLSTVDFTLKAKVENFKLIAREALRMNLISPRLTKVSGLENNIKKQKNRIKEVSHQVEVEVYDISKLDENHPNYTKQKETAEDYLKDLKEVIEDYKKEIKETEKLIEEQAQGIARIETGETKVSQALLNDLVETLIKKDAENQLRA